MQIINSKNFRLENTCVSIGKFDGLHAGHQELFVEMEKYRGRYPLVIFSFDMLNESEKIYSSEKKITYLNTRGYDYLINYPFDEKTRNMEPEIFVEKVLVDALGIKVLTVGDNFRFGHNRAGDTKLLEKLSMKYSFKLNVVPCLKFENENISSSRIRELLGSGDNETAERLLQSNFWSVTKN